MRPASRETFFSSLAVCSQVSASSEAGSNYPVVAKELYNQRCSTTVGALQPEVIFGDIADQILLGQTDRGVGFDVTFDVFFERVFLAGEGDVDLDESPILKHSD